MTCIIKPQQVILVTRGVHHPGSGVNIGFGGAGKHPDQEVGDCPGHSIPIVMRLMTTLKTNANKKKLKNLKAEVEELESKVDRMSLSEV